MKEKKDPAILEASFSLSFFYFFSSVTRVILLPIKGEAGHPMKGDQTTNELETQEHEMSTHMSDNRALSTRSLLPPETWDHLSLACL